MSPKALRWRVYCQSSGMKHDSAMPTIFSVLDWAGNPVSRALCSPEPGFSKYLKPWTGAAA